MKHDNNDRQTKYKAKMYRAGFKQIALWIKDKPIKRYLSISAFLDKCEKLLVKFSVDEQNKLISLIINILESRKEVLKTKNKKKNLPEANKENKGRG